MNIREAILWGKSQLIEVCERPQYEAELLLAYVLQKDKIYLITHAKEMLKESEIYRSLVARRAMHEPYEYIVGEASFYDISLTVEPGVLIPRPETELLIDRVSEVIAQKGIERIAEIGVGSGAISIVLARKFPRLKSIATDICQKPLQMAHQNIERFGLENQIELRKSNLLDAVPEEVALVVSNPPYIAEGFALAPNVVAYEPKEALFGGIVGDELLKQIIVDVKAKGVSYLACEMGYDQKASIEAFVKEVGVESIGFYQDLAGFDRGFLIQFKEL